MEKGNLFSLIYRHMKELLKKIILMEKGNQKINYQNLGFIYGQIKGNMKGIGSWEKCMEKEQ